MDKSLGLNVLVECLDKGGKSSPVKAAVVLYFLVFIGVVRVFNSLSDGIAEFFISKFN